MYIILEMGGLFCICLEWGENVLNKEEELIQGAEKVGRRGRETQEFIIKLSGINWSDTPSLPSMTPQISRRPLGPGPVRQFWRKQK